MLGILACSRRAFVRLRRTGDVTMLWNNARSALFHNIVTSGERRRRE